jgi:ribonucleoside-diphosphate reductase alpha chain
MKGKSDMEQEIYDYNSSLKKSTEYFNGDKLAAKVFLDKYALRDNKQNLLEDTPDKMHIRIATELARIEKKKFKNPMSFEEILSYIQNFKKIVPQGSLMYGIGNPYQFVTLSNCFAIASPLDSYSGILYTDQQMVQICKRRGGVGTDISNLRPDGTPTTNAARTSTGIVSFMERYSNSIREVGQSGRRGAALLTISIHHPEVLKFAKIKRDLTKVTGANISIRLTDEFLEAVEKNEEYEMRWPVDSKTPKISRIVNAKEVWRQIVENAHAMAEPGILLWNKIISESPADCYAKYGFATVSCNPCSELVLSPCDSCRLLLLNLFNYVENPFTKHAKFDFEQFYKDAQIAQRFMDNVIDLELEHIDRIIKKVEEDPEPEAIKATELSLWKEIYRVCETGRRTGTGSTGLGDTLAALGLKYDSNKGIKTAKKIYRIMKLGCYRSSVEMAKELGPFKIWEHNLEKKNPFLLRIKEEDPELYKDMKKYGRRNIGILTSSPAGSVSILTQTTSGIEPLFKMEYKRRKKINPNDKNARVDFVDQNGDSWEEFIVYHPKVKMWMKITGETDLTKSPWYGACAEDIDWKKRIQMQAVAGKNIDHSISSTINLTENVTVEEVMNIYEAAWKAGLKGITVYRKNSRTGVLIDKDSNCVTRDSDNINKHDAPKRPKVLPCDIYHISVKGQDYLTIVGLLSDDPYEIFALKNGQIPKSHKTGMLKKVKRGHYKLITNSGSEIENIMDESGEMEEAITRLVSASLRHGADISFIVEQLEKTKSASFGTFEKAIARSLKKYIDDGKKVNGEECEECGNELIREQGCKNCRNCGWTACS